MEPMLYGLAEKLVIGLLCLLVFVVGVIGNALVIILVVNQQKMKTTTNVFIVQLAVSDLIILFFCMPFTVTSVYMTEDWVFGKAMCGTVMFLQVFAVLLSVLTLTAMNIERYFKIVHPLATYAVWTVRSCVKICAGIVVVATLLSLPRPLLGGMLNIKEGMPWDPRIPEHSTDASLSNVSDYTDSNGTKYTPVPFLFCFEDLGPQANPYFVPIYNTVRIVLFFFLPLVFDGYISRAIDRALQQSTSMHAADDARKDRMRNVTVMMRLMIVVFAVCWLPYQGFLAIQAVNDRELFRQEWFQKGMIVVSIFLYMHCISNPILYYKMNSRFRKGFRRYLCCCCDGPHAMSRHGTTSSSTTSTSSMMKTFRRRVSEISILGRFARSDIDAGVGHDSPPVFPGCQISGMENGGFERTDLTGNNNDVAARAEEKMAAAT